MTRLPVAILAGGLATRLGAVARRTPKCLLEVAGRPFLYHQLRQLHDQGVRQVVLCLGHLSEQVMEIAGDGSAFDLEVAYSFDGPELQGTAGAIKNALPLLSSSFFVLYGDSYLECSYAAVQEAYQAAGQMALMTVFRNQGCWDNSNVEFHNDRILAYDKVHRTDRMQHIDYGLGVLHREAFDIVPATRTFDLAAVYQEMLRQGRLAGFEVMDRFYEIGSVEGLEETRKHLSARGNQDPEKSCHTQLSSWQKPNR
jgi:N-acetyl-alpha-D-muramate 1-phosphate uridylyltransferase